MSSSEDERPKKSKSSKKEKRARESSSEDSGPDDKAPVKKAKTTSKHTTNDQGEEMMEFGPKRYVTVRDFRGKTYVDIREYFDDKKTGKLAPGKKGISLSRDQYENLKKLMAEIDEKIGIA